MKHRAIWVKMSNILDIMTNINYSKGMKDEYDIAIFQTADGKEPLTEWLESLKDSVAKRTILIRIQRIRQGNFGDSDPVGDGLHELRIHFGPGYRVYFANVGDKLVLLLAAGLKGDQKKDIKKCKVYLEEYKET
jgi:putative addiction module killer protein